MKIAFCCQHSYYGGLADNGGSQTIIKSCQILNKMGHKAVIVTKSDKHTWINHERPVRHIPRDVDVTIACSVSDIKPMLKTKPEKVKAYWWCRLLEDYQMSKSKIVERAGKVRVLVNSEGLQKWFRGRDISSKIVYQGYDKSWVGAQGRYKNYVGFLLSSKKRKRFSFIKHIVNRLKDGYKFVGFGNDINREMRNFIKSKFTYFVENAGYYDRLSLYASTGVWVSVSVSEGLHNCPMEAALCGCAVVYPDALLAGCKDYCENVAWKYESHSVTSVAERIKEADQSRNEAQKQLIIDKIGTRRENMIKLISILQKGM